MNRRLIILAAAASAPLAPPQRADNARALELAGIRYRIGAVDLRTVQQQQMALATALPRRVVAEDGGAVAQRVRRHVRCRRRVRRCPTRSCRPRCVRSATGRRSRNSRPQATQAGHQGRD